MSENRPWWRDPRLLLLLTGAAVVATAIAGAELARPCSVAQPCRPSAVSAASIGLLAGSMIAVYLHARTAAWLATAMAVTFVLADIADPVMPWWVYLAVAGHAAVGWYVSDPARRAGDPGPAGTPPVTDHRPAPAPDTRLPVLGRRWFALAGVLAVVVAALTWWSYAEQARKDAQQRAALQVTGTVREHVDEFTARVDLPDGSSVKVDVLDAADHPVGGPIALHVDGRGLRQPVSEPYDATGWLALAATAGSVALAGALRALDTNSALRRLFATAQPVRAVRAVENYHEVYVFLPGSGPGRAAVATMPAVYADPSDADPSDADPSDADPSDADPSDADPSDADPSDTRFADVPVPAVLYGDPRPGKWCAVQVGGRLRVPSDPVESLLDVSVDTVTGEHLPVADEPAVELTLLAAADRRATPAEPRLHRMHPLIAWARALGAVPVTLATVGQFVAGLVAPLDAVAAVAIAAPLTAAALYFGWRRWLRPYLCWNAGGLVEVTPWRIVRVTWSARTRVEQTEGGGVLVIADEDEHEEDEDDGETFVAVVARRHFRLLPAARGERTADELANALRYAREQALATAGAVPPPTVEPPRPPVGPLLACWFVLASLGAAALLWLTAA
ncbi:hypothetical protein ACN27G_36215 [Plantactinospora sp. WMMB334]|uniref:hypothetical protein n=1 Tax=Plantactinospora sp. WMMB334 TaxID=3404119 RepID=UPI003B950F6A